ncbi:MAG: DNA polymerase III subunit delta' [Cellulomonadaceae bacterium]|jgi:DNA polymerase-3 subunit delta'|nr:DNA polymerase III subunit delta' [Cellulomonadaceae bacterium]
MQEATPATVWDAVVGQVDAVKQLQQAGKEPKALTHAWLLVGPPGSGRSTAARAFAAALECDSRTGCGQCPGCKMVLAGTHPDVKTVTTEAVTIAIKDVRDLVEQAAAKPSVGRYRVFVIEDVDRMSQGAANVLLKAVEEPPPGTIWLLCGPTAQDVIPTIRSRCRIVRLQVPKVSEVADLLIREGVPAENALAAAQTAGSHIGMARWLAKDPGAMQRRLATFEMLSATRSVPAAAIQAAALVEGARAEAAAATNVSDEREITQLRSVLGLASDDAIPAKLRTQFKDLEEDQKRRARRAERDVLQRTCSDLLTLLRDVLVLQFQAEVLATNGASPAAARLTADLAVRLTPAQTLERVDAVLEAQARLAANVPALLAMEAMLLALRW